jgi:branched-subunit amino acid aminotransferase/4-amino-4-deoxychorismate lyase
VVWLDAIERRYIEEMGGMNLFFVFGSGGTARLVTPELSGSLLPGITRNSLLQLAGDAGFAVEERKIDVQEWRKGVAAGEITEVFACGTAAVITPVSQVKFGDGEFTVGDGTPGEVTMALQFLVMGQATVRARRGRHPSHGGDRSMAPLSLRSSTRIHTSAARVTRERPRPTTGGRRHWIPVK